MILNRSCALRAVSHLLATGMHRKEQTVRQQLRAWYYGVERKRGTKRQALAVATCFPVLLSWVGSWWHGTQLALALDAMALGTRFVVLAVSVVYRGCALPVAWVVLPAKTKHAWRREWRWRWVSTAAWVPSRPRAPRAGFPHGSQRAVAAGGRRWGTHTHGAQGLLKYLSTREALYRILSEHGNPQLLSIEKVLQVLGLRLAVTRAL
jgi:hypothetical protein